MNQEIESVDRLISNLKEGNCFLIPLTENMGEFKKIRQSFQEYINNKLKGNYEEIIMIKVLDKKNFDYCNAIYSILLYEKNTKDLVILDYLDYFDSFKSEKTLKIREIRSDLDDLNNLLNKSSIGQIGFLLALKKKTYLELEKELNFLIFEKIKTDLSSVLKKSIIVKNLIL